MCALLSHLCFLARLRASSRQVYSFCVFLFFLFTRPVHVSRGGHGYVPFSHGEGPLRNWDYRLGREAQNNAVDIR